MAKKKETQEPKPHRGRRVFAVILVLLLLAALTLYVIPLTEVDSGERVDGSGDWMRALDDGLRLSELAIPGTHDSATRYVSLAFFSKCQTKDIGSQLEAGYRYLDIRLAVDGEQMKLVHGFTSCKTGALPWSAVLHLDKVLQQCYVFLENHPSETILFAVKQEAGKESVAEFQRVLDGYIQKDPDRWLPTDTIPTLGEARGKLVLLRRYSDEAGLGARAGVPLLWTNQTGSSDVSLGTVSEDNEGCRLWVQDRYCYAAEDKWNVFIAGLGAGEPGDMTISFLSTKGTLPVGHPYKYASALNPRLLGRALTKTDGWIIVDFATAPLAKHIYDANFE